MFFLNREILNWHKEKKQQVQRFQGKYFLFLFKTKSCQFENHAIESSMKNTVVWKPMNEMQWVAFGMEIFNLFFMENCWKLYAPLTINKIFPLIYYLTKYFSYSMLNISAHQKEEVTIYYITSDCVFVFFIYISENKINNALKTTAINCKERKNVIITLKISNLNNFWHINFLQLLMQFL